ncbi:4Fe-4S dicluster domain-containing protein [SCandidatus Aminicenantes bacterium Aminicenantia_JdfR_composite]|jgi:heterodisulfide reductase subunit C|nr:4Fe-4S dicluster domain-containing protein [SCandidatus Aminicenantes bacterium Aminicenantia_JdfR_composite]MCP2596920.1 4Fe-4S dicluster domain-containing protein [Candidatus Aminicenantes bacterium AC-335-G13]MCP2598372.1 4Fe-4S dicluster domain-containing protein [Candidatus Aminicenantes bacterium AC-335-L06]MCP2621169.1 4Fe-4S dicluster domain-containing protein [Candidatus Aminicenantes bacterium AC-334-E05]
MRIELNGEKIRNNFVAKISEISGQNLLACYQCGKCSAGCPLVSEMDILPNQVIRFAQLGLIEELLSCKSIWICASCLTCNTRCPRGVNIAEVMEAIRLILLRKNIDNLKIIELNEKRRVELPQIALVSSFRKKTA